MQSHSISVRLQPMVTKVQHALLGMIEQETQTFQIFCTANDLPEQMIGFVDKKPNSDIHIIIGGLPLSVTNEITRQVKELHANATGSVTSIAPPPDQIAEAEASDEEIEEDES